MTLAEHVQVRGLDADAMRRARERQAQLVKPPGSLGRLEELAVWLAGVTGETRPAVRARVVVAADHGVAAEGVSAFPAEVTGQMLATFLSGRGAVCVLAGGLGAELVCVDAGVAADTTSLDVVRSGLRPSANLATGPALSREDVMRAIDLGRQLAARAAADAITVLVGGETGIANTTPATCLTCWLTGKDPEQLTGAGTGLDAEGIERKAGVVRRALELHGDAIANPLDALAWIGGGEIAVLCGLAVGAGEHGLGYVCDGVIATAAVAVAVALLPELRARLLAGHRSAEPAHGALLEHLDLQPLLDLGMRLGEASGGVVALGVLRAAIAAHDGMATFAEPGVSES